MPQFELTFYLSQAFWMLVSFSCLFFLMSTVILPALNDILSKRRQRIDGTLSDAERLNKQAEQLMYDYDSFMEKAVHEKNELVKKAYAAITQKNTKVEADHDRVLRDMILETQAQINLSKQRMNDQSDKLATEIAQKLVDKFSCHTGGQ